MVKFNNKVIWCSFLFTLSFTLPLGLVALIFGTIQINTCYNFNNYNNVSENRIYTTHNIFEAACTCDYIDFIGLNVSHYLIGLGILNIVLILILIPSFAMTLVTGKNYHNITSSLAAYLGAIFGIVLFIIGAVILFRSNIECINKGFVYIVLALVMWCLSYIQLIKDCTWEKINNQ